MAKAYVKDGVIYVEAPFLVEGKLTASRKNVLHATTEAGTPDALTIQVGNKKMWVQLNVWSPAVKKEVAVAK